MKATRQPASPRTGLSSPPRIPLMPAMRPLSNTNIAAAKPISRPPASAGQGVKAFQSRVIVCLLCFLQGNTVPALLLRYLEHQAGRGRMRIQLAIRPDDAALGGGHLPAAVNDGADGAQRPGLV